MGWSTCKYCGEKIRWAQMPAGNYLPWDPENGELHECVPYERSDPSPQTREWTIADPDLSVTYPTSCWWCGEEVFFHSNGSGDCVLFDKLGWPWQVHACWEEHVAERSSALSAIDAELETAGFDGRFYQPRSELVPPGCGGSEVIVEGFVADNHALYSQPQQIDLSVLDQGNSPAFFSVDVADSSERLFRFIIPQEAAKRLDDYGLVRMKGVWQFYQDRSYLIATSYRQQLYSPRSVGESISWQRRTPLGTCYYCGCQFSKSTIWGPECEKCSTARGALTSREFLVLCRRVAAYRGSK
ncbi:hypothetical protein [Nitrosococcus wardiae]|uniref:Uncharacterized protein n=1 Tax=Nitrosococcus wardiae TaxID=1814290 RepID=A0A4P7BXG5_9GAMM|nr:hypothetical protein [Nitrosococcus wardiae]QBQ53834.1 hypothetical protein E3U44_04385 [Nitrosococcus wardiae]